MADVLKQLKYSWDHNIIETIYLIFYIGQKLEYGSHIWDNCSKQDSEAHEKFQLQIARIVTGARKGTSHKLIYLINISRLVGKNWLNKGQFVKLNIC
jgi:hypothetical protein